MKADAVNTRQVLLHKKPDIADWFYIPSWKQSTLPDLLKNRDAGHKVCWLVFVDRCELGSQIVKRLEQEGQDVITVMVGEQFNKICDRGYTINPQQRDDYDALLEDLCVLNKIPKIVHLWNVTLGASHICKFAKSGEIGDDSRNHLCFLS